MWLNSPGGGHWDGVEEFYWAGGESLMIIKHLKSKKGERERNEIGPGEAQLQTDLTAATKPTEWFSDQAWCIQGFQLWGMATIYWLNVA